MFAAGLADLTQVQVHPTIAIDTPLAVYEARISTSSR